MGDNNDRDGTPNVRETFAGMLGELEDVATVLTKRQAALAKELADVEAELHRVEDVRRIMAGQPPKTPARNRPRQGEYMPGPTTQEKISRVLAWAKERDSEFIAADAAGALEANTQGVGPLLAGMVRRGSLTVREDHGRRFYSVA